MANSTKQRMTIFLKVSIARHAKARAAVDGVSLSELVAKALIKYLPKETVLRSPHFAHSILPFNHQFTRQRGDTLLAAKKRIEGKKTSK